jgi:molybdate transport system regulatory protein
MRITIGREALNIGFKVWLDNNGKAFGDGPYELLRRVEVTRSLHRAANQMGMSYSKAWRLIQTLEQRLCFALIERKVGGQSGGGSHVTPRGKDLINHYERFRKDVEKGLEKIFQKHFGSPPHPIPLPQGERGRSLRLATEVRGRKEQK